MRSVRFGWLFAFCALSCCEDKLRRIVRSSARLRRKLNNNSVATCLSASFGREQQLYQHCENSEHAALVGCELI